MAERHIAITAISDSAAESFVTSTLFSQGWDIYYRALDFESLLSQLDLSELRSATLLISTDFDGLNESGLSELKELVERIIIFRANSDETSHYPDAIALPTQTLDFISLMRGTLRNPMIRHYQKPVPARTSKILAIGSVSGGVGCTTFALNLAVELSTLEKRVLVVDAHPNLPSLSPLIGQHGLNSDGEFRKISQYLLACEVDQKNIIERIESLDRATAEFDFIVIDLGTLSDVASDLSGRRWSGQMMMWVSAQADLLMVMAPSDRVGLHRLRTLTTELMTNAIKPSLTFIRVLRQQGKRDPSGSENFLKVVTSLRPGNTLEYPYDPRSVLKAESDQSALIDSNERGIVRRMIAEIAGELAS